MVDIALQSWLVITLGGLVLLAVVVLVQGLVEALRRAVRPAARVVVVVPAPGASRPLQLSSAPR